VWLKDTSSDGTLLNEVLLHNTARIILHDDVLTIAGRKFRFEVVAVRYPRFFACDMTPRLYYGGVVEYFSADCDLCDLIETIAKPDSIKCPQYSWKRY